MNEIRPIGDDRTGRVLNFDWPWGKLRATIHRSVSNAKIIDAEGNVVGELNFEITEPKAASPPADLTCIHRGERVRAVDCPSCHGNVRLKIYICAVHGECSLQRNSGDQLVKVCAQCPDITPP